jgi:hypothetical protein
VHNFRLREWAPAVTASGVERPARLYDLRSTFASNSLAAGITVYELARVMGTSVAMIEAHYGALLDTAAESMLARLEAGPRAQLMPETLKAGLRSRAKDEAGDGRKPAWLQAILGTPRDGSQHAARLAKPALSQLS